jgi:hypothetical protein
MTGPDPNAGPLLFARYAYPPNALGYCGADDAPTLLQRTSAASVDLDLRRTLRTFEGAWPYLELIAHANAIADPLDAAVVEAYWIGNGLLDHVDARLMSASLEERFRPRLGLGWDPLGAAAGAGARPHHSFHVLGVFPYVGLLRAGVVDEPLTVLDRCRIRWGRVVALGVGSADVSSRPLEWDGRRLRLGAERVERATTTLDGATLTRPLAIGDWCSLHWDWVCDRLDDAQVRQLRARTAQSLAAANDAPAVVLA